MQGWYGRVNVYASACTCVCVCLCLRVRACMHVRWTYRRQKQNIASIDNLKKQNMSKKKKQKEN